jgi:hypothetical protein
MKGQIPRTPQSTRSNSCLLCALFIAMSFSIDRCGFAAESTNSHRRFSIIVPTDSATAENPLVINASSTNRVRQDGLVIGSTNISDPREMLQIYADVRGRTIRWPTNLPFPNVTFSADKPLTPHETILALDVFFGLNGIALIDIGEKWVKAARSESCQTASNLMHQTEYLTHFEHLTYLKPGDLVPTLQPFASGAANAILPLNAERAVLLRSFPQNVQKMRDVIRELDVAIPTEFISEVIPIKHAKASEIAAALKKQIGTKIPSLDRNLIADKRTNSLLVYASREEMKQIKEIISHLDLINTSLQRGAPVHGGENQLF